jgi:hypothetical protein
VLLLLTLLAAVMVAATPPLGASLADERAAAAVQRADYVPVHGTVHDMATGDDLTFAGESAETGPVELVIPWDTNVFDGDEITVLVNRGDRGDFVLPDEQARPGVALGLLIGTVAVAVTAAGLATIAGRRRRGDPAAVRSVATVPPETAPPGRSRPAVRPGGPARSSRWPRRWRWCR